MKIGYFHQHLTVTLNQQFVAHLLELQVRLCISLEGFAWGLPLHLQVKLAASRHIELNGLTCGLDQGLMSHNTFWRCQSSDDFLHTASFCEIGRFDTV